MAAPGRARRYELQGVERRRVKRKRLRYALKVEAVPDVVEPLRDGSPIREKLVVGRYAEQWPAGGHDRELREAAGRRVGQRARPWRDDDGVLDVDQRVREQIDLLQRRIGRQRLLRRGAQHDLIRRAQRKLVGLGPEDHVGEDIELLGLGDHFGPVLRIVPVAPGDQVVEKLHHRRLAVGRNACARDRMRIERVVDPGFDCVRCRRIAEALVGINGKGREQGGDLLVGPVGGLHCVERRHLPVALRRGACAAVRRVEDVFEPRHRILELVVLHQLRGDEHRRVIEDLPVVQRIGAGGRWRKIQKVLARIGRRIGQRVGLAGVRSRDVRQRVVWPTGVVVR